MYEPVRKIRPTRRSVSGCHSFRGHTSIPYESTLERDFVILQEFNHHVRQIISQPVAIPFVLRNRTYHYTPDYLVLFQDHDHKGMLVEVKPETKWRKNWREWLTKWKAAYRWANERGFLFHIYDESRIRGIVLHNTQSLLRFRHPSNNVADTDIACRLIAQTNGVKVSDFLSHFPLTERNQWQQLLWHLLANGILRVDLTEPLSENTLVFIESRQHGY